MMKRIFRIFCNGIIQKFKNYKNNHKKYQNRYYFSNNQVHKCIALQNGIINIFYQMNNNILIAFIVLLILFSLYLIGRNEIPGAGTINRIISNKVTTPSTVNINLDSGFDNFKDHSKLNFDKLHCELYEEKNKHINPLGKASLSEYDTLTSQLLLSLIKEINKVKTQKNLLENLKLSKPTRINLDTAKLERLYNNLLRSKDIIDSREEQIKILKQNFKPSVVSGKQFEIDVEKQLINYLEKRLKYLTTLKPKSQMSEPEGIQKIQRTLNTTETAIKTILSDIDKNKNKVKSTDEINKFVNLQKYWILRLEEVKKCQKTDQNYRTGQGVQIYRELQRLQRQQKGHQNEGYCMQLKKHLVLKLIRQFDAIQSDFNCLKQKGKIEEQLIKLQNDIERLKKQGSANDYNPNLNDDNLNKLQKSYESATHAFENVVKKVQVGYDATTLREMIDNIEKELNSHKRRLQDLNSGRGSDNTEGDPQKIVNLVNLNIKMKSEYCKDFQEYEKQNQLLRNKLDQISAQRSARHVATQRYFAISNEIKKSLVEISRIKQNITGRLKI